MVSDYMTPTALQTQVGLQASDTARPPLVTFRKVLKTALGIKPASEAKQVTDQQQKGSQGHFRPHRKPNNGSSETKSGDDHDHLDIKA
jgi:hypothetical protein